jgi:hypothetical protein
MLFAVEEEPFAYHTASPFVNSVFAVAREIKLADTPFDPTVRAVVAAATRSAKSSLDHTKTTLAVLLPTEIDTFADVRSARAYAFAVVEP